MKRFTFAITITLFLCTFCNLNAQQKCGFDILRQKQLQDLNFVKLERTAEKRIQDAIKNKDYSKMAGTELTIPVVVHVLHLGEAIGTGTNISDAQIQSSIDNLNDYYGGQIPSSPLDFEIQFGLAQRDPDCNTTSGINRIDASGVPGYLSDGVAFAGAGADETTLKDLSRWPESDYFNIWIVTEIDGNDGGYGYQGYANFYSGYAYEGSVMMYTVFGFDPTNSNPSWPLTINRDNSTVVHEAGHYFHLYHTFQGDGSGGTCPTDTIIGTNSDGCADTVPHKRETSTCPGINDCTGSPWIDNNTINNIMSYYSCSDRLTNDQKTRVRAAMENTSIVNSKGSIAPDINYTAPTAVCNLNAATNLTGDYAGIVNVELNGINFSSYPAASDGGNIDKTSNCSNYFEIDATESNTLYVQVSVNTNQLGVWIDWNDDGDFNDDAEVQYPVTQGIAANTNVAINLSYPTTIPHNDYVRLRIIEDLYIGYGLNPITSACYQNLAYGQSEDYTIYVKPNGFTTYTYNNTWSPTSPVGISNISDVIIIEAGTANFNTDTDCSTLTVNPGAALTIDTEVLLTANSVDLNSTSQLFSSLISDGTINATVNYNRYTAQVGPVGTNDLISAPISGQLFPAFATLNPNLPSSGMVRAFGPYNTSAGAYQNYNLVTNALTTIEAGIGYRTATTTTNGSALTFTGTIRTDDVLGIPITDAAAGYAWNLIGNPYPSYIDFETFFTANASQFGDGYFQAIYGYDGDASNGWTVWNMTSILNLTITELIAPGQAFFVKSKENGGLVNFTTGMRRTGTDDDFNLGRQPVNNVAYCMLNLSSATNNSSTQIYFIEGTTRGLDAGYDAGTYTASSTDFSIYSNLVEQNTGINMAIQSLPYEDFNNIVIPVGIIAQAGEALSIAIDVTSNLPSNINVYLEDKVANTWSLLNNSDYTFSPTDDLNGTGRFYLHYSAETLSTENSYWDNLQVYSTSSPKEIVIKGYLLNDTKTSLYDIRGRLILSTDLTSHNYNTIDISNIGSGAYIIKIYNKDQTKTQKLIIN